MYARMLFNVHLEVLTLDPLLGHLYGFSSFINLFWESSCYDHIQDLLGKGDDDPSGQCQEAVGPLAWVMAL